MTFKQAARYVRQFIASKLGQGTADAIPIDTLQGAYIATVRRHAEKAVTPKAEVVAIESIAELDEDDRHHGARAAAVRATSVTSPIRV